MFKMLKKLFSKSPERELLESYSILPLLESCSKQLLKEANECTSSASRLDARFAELFNLTEMPSKESLDNSFLVRHQSRIFKDCAFVLEEVAFNLDRVLETRNLEILPKVGSIVLQPYENILDVDSCVTFKDGITYIPSYLYSADILNNVLQEINDRLGYEMVVYSSLKTVDLDPMIDRNFVGFRSQVKSLDTELRICVNTNKVLKALEKQAKRQFSKNVNPFVFKVPADDVDLAKVRVALKNVCKEFQIMDARIRCAPSNTTEHLEYTVSF